MVTVVIHFSSIFFAMAAKTGVGRQRCGCGIGGRRYDQIKSEPIKDDEVGDGLDQLVLEYGSSCANCQIETRVNGPKSVPQVETSSGPICSCLAIRVLKVAQHQW